MKRIIYKTVFVTVLMLISMSVFAQTSSTMLDSTYSLNSPTGTFSITGNEYFGIRKKEWKINIGAQKPVKIDLEYDIFANDFLDIYALTADNNEYLILTVTGTDAVSISTVLPTGKAKVQFRMNYGYNYPYNAPAGDYYDGFTASFSGDNVTNTSVSQNAYVNKSLSVLGDAGIGTTSTAGKRLSVSAASQYGIYSVNNSTSRNPYGIYSSVSNTTTAGNLYGLYSSVSGTSDKKWAGYFTGGDLEITGGILKANNGVIVGGGNVGIGTTSPAYNLDVSGTSRTTGNAVFSGNVGIGTTAPASKLDVRGSVYIPSGQSYWIGSNTDSGNRLRLHHASAGGCIDYAPSLYIRAGTTNVMFLGQNGNVGIGMASPAYKLDVSGTSRTTGNAIFNGNVGIGITSPAYKLDVNGIIRASEVKIETGWADFVFNDDYHLKPLSEVNSFIQENKHLPEIPSSTEVKENEGIGIGEMQVKLLQKIEELTLYLIQQENTIQELKSEIRELKEK